MGYLRNIFVSVDQLGNALAGGDPDNTISARIGFYNHHKHVNGVSASPHPVKWYWKAFEDIVDTTFRPVDGDGHCHEAYHSDAGEFFDPHTKNWAVGVLSVLIIGSCIPLFIIFRVVGLFRSPNDPDKKRPERVENRLKRINVHLLSLIHEFDENPELRLDDSTLKVCDEISEKIEKIKAEIKRRNAQE